MKRPKLYDYQLDMKRRIDVAFQQHRSVMVQMPTGTGKTYLLAAIVYSELQRSPLANVWIVVHRKELVEQIEQTLLYFEQLYDGVGDALPQQAQLAFGQRVHVWSIQWLCKHYKELNVSPSLIVIDEAHHAVATTYAELMNAYPDAKKLGVTATPCRLSQQGFTHLFDELLLSWSVNQFIANGRLSLYDYMTVKADCEELQKVLELKKRGADGDFSLKEMSLKFDVRPSIKRLYETVAQYAPHKKGITYAINIAHAQHIANYYCAHNIKAVAISSKTPSHERRNAIEGFKAGNIEVLVNVDLFGEGFDCPDVEFIQLARPTLSLAKYLQQVGRGLRVFKGKRYCLILDNVGLYRLFGLPSDERDWLSMFRGQLRGKGLLPQAQAQGSAPCFMQTGTPAVTQDAQTLLVTVMSHKGQRFELDMAYGYQLSVNEQGWQGVTDRAGRVVLPCQYRRVELKPNGLALLHSRRKLDQERPWIDLYNGMRFVKEPRIERHGFMEFCTTDGQRLYPRVPTRLFNDHSFVVPQALAHGIDLGLQFQNYFIPPSMPLTLYTLKGQLDALSLWQNELGEWFWRKGRESTLHPTTPEEWALKEADWKAEKERFEEQTKLYVRFFKPRIVLKALGEKRLLKDYHELDGFKIKQQGHCSCQVQHKLGLAGWQLVGSFAHVAAPAYGLRVVQKADGRFVLRNEQFEVLECPEPSYDFAELLDNAFFHFTEKGQHFWVYLENKLCFTQQPQMVRIGFMDFIKVGDVYFECSACNATPYRRAEISTHHNICYLGKRWVIINSSPHRSYYYVQQRYADGCRFIVTAQAPDSAHQQSFELYDDGTHAPILTPNYKATASRLAR